MPPQPCVFHRSQVQNSPFHVRTVNLLLDSHVLLNMEAKAIHDSQCIYVYVHIYISFQHPFYTHVPFEGIRHCSHSSQHARLR